MELKFSHKGHTYRSAKSLRKILEEAPKTEKQVIIFAYLIGVYSCRMFGFVRYRTKSGYDTDKIRIGRKLSECKTDE